MKNKSAFYLTVALTGYMVLVDFLATAQSIRVLDEDLKPIEGVVVDYSSIGNSRASTTVLTDRKGTAELKSPVFPVLRQLSHIGYATRVDTIYQAVALQELKLLKDPRSLGEVTVTGNFMATHALTDLVPVQVLQRSDFEKRGAVTVKDLLIQELNVQVGTDPVLGASVSMQGTGGEHIKILVDGVPVIGRQNGAIDLGQLNLSNIERVEMIKGPMSVMYGTDALGGVMNLITKKPSADKIALSTSAFYESTGQYNADATAEYALKNAAFSLNAGRNYFDGFDPDVKSTRSPLWNPREQLFTSLKYSQLFKSWKLTAQGSWFDETVSNKSEVIITPYFAYANDQYYTTVRGNVQATADKRWQGNRQLLFTSAYSKYRYVRNTYRKNMVDLSEALTADPLDDDTTVFDAFFSRAVFSSGGKEDRFSWTVLADLNHEKGRGRRIDNSTHFQTDAGLCLSADIRAFSTLTIRPSVRVMYNSQFSAPVVPSLNVLFRPSVDWLGRLTLSKGFRAPSLKEQFLNFVDNGIHDVQGNPDLLSETSTQLTAGAEFNKAIGKSVVTLNAGVFYNAIENKISLVQFSENSTRYTYINLDAFTTQGVEGSLRFARERFSMRAGAAYTGTWSTFEGDIEQPALAWYPELNASADVEIPWIGSTVSLFWKYFGERPVFLLVEQEAVQRFENPSYQLVDASMRRSFLKDKLVISAGVRNLLNVTNLRTVAGGGIHSGASDGLSPVAMGTSFFTRLTYTLK